MAVGGRASVRGAGASRFPRAPAEKRGRRAQGAGAQGPGGRGAGGGRAGPPGGRGKRGGAGRGGRGRGAGGAGGRGGGGQGAREDWGGRVPEGGAACVQGTRRPLPQTSPPASANRPAPIIPASSP